MLAQLALDAREDGLHWLWSDEEFDEEELTFPSCDISMELGFEGHGNLELNLKKVHGVELEGVAWDTEFSAWYPRFETKEFAFEARRKLDEVLDKQYMSILKELAR